MRPSPSIKQKSIPGHRPPRRAVRSRTSLAKKMFPKVLARVTFPRLGTSTRLPMWTPRERTASKRYAAPSAHEPHRSQRDVDCRGGERGLERVVGRKSQLALVFQTQQIQTRTHTNRNIHKIETISHLAIESFGFLPNTHYRSLDAPLSLSASR